MAKTDIRKPFFCNWRKIGRKYLLTNDFGHYAFLGEAEFRKWKSGRVGLKSELGKNLSEKGFFSDYMNFDSLAKTLDEKNVFLHFGPSLHILVLTLRCNHHCLYCQSGALPAGGKKADMDIETARKAVDFAFKSNNPSITIEFQGGEPLLNWRVFKQAVAYARKHEEARNRKLSIALVTNFSLMDASKADFILKNEISVCTSLDGPRAIHDRNRPYSKGSSHEEAVKWIRYFREKHDNQDGKYRVFKPSALMTVTRFSLDDPEGIVDEYVRLGLEDIFIRPMTPIGYARRVWDKIGYSAGEFLAFYGRALKYILKLNAEGVEIKEKNAVLLLEKILKRKDPGYMDLRWPCGAGIGQLAYDWNGRIYTCDEGRMLAQQGENLFGMGKTGINYEKAVNSGACRACAISSNLEQQPECFRCAYKPFCGVCPVYNWEEQGSLWGNMKSNDRCVLYKGMFDLVFSLLSRKREAEILEKWLERK